MDKALLGAGAVVAVLLGALAAFNPLAALALVGVGAVLGLMIGAAPQASALLLVTGVFLQQPTSFAQVNTGPVGVVLVLMAATLAVLTDHGLNLPRTQAVRALIGVPLLLWLWITIQAVATSDPLIKDTMRGAVSITITVLCAAAVVSSTHRARIALKAFVVLMGALGASAAITMIGIALKVNLFSVPYGQLPLQSNWLPADIRVPFSPGTTTTFEFGPLTFPRALGIFREPGIFPVFLMLAFFAMDAVLTSTVRRIMGLALIGGIIASGSTAGIIIFPIALLLRYVVLEQGRSAWVRRVAAVLLTPLALWAILTNRFVGLQAKAEKAPTSVDDRTTATISGLQRLAENPLGSGIHSTMTDNSSINLLAASGDIGLPGLLIPLIGLLVACIVMAPRVRQRVAPAVLALVITMLSSQPLLDAAAVWATLIIVTAGCFVTERPASSDDVGEPEQVSRGQVSAIA